MNIPDAETFRLLVESVHDYAIFMLDVDGHVATWNRGAERIKRYQADEIIGRHFSAFYTPADVANDKPTRALAVARREGRFEEEGRRVRADGSTFLANVVITPLWDDEGQLRGFAKVTRDITERTELRSQLEHSQRMDALGTLASGVAHDVNNVLTSIVGNASFLADDLAGGQLDHDAASAFVSQILQACEQASSLVSRLLTFSRDRGQAPTPLSVREVVDGAVGLSRPARAPDIALAVAVPGGIRVMADRSELEHAVLNILINAQQALGSRGQITVTAGVVDRMVHLSIADDGPGMDARTLRRCTEPFFTTGKTGGSGLGMALAYAAADRTGGRLEVESSPGGGTTVRFVLPAADASASPAPPPSGRPRRRAGQGTVLLVEDRQHVRAVNRVALQRGGFQVLEAADGIAALEVLAAADRIDIVVSDVQMPRMDGAVLAEIASIQRPDLPVLLVTGHEFDQDDLPGEVQVMRKPFTPTELVDRVLDVLGAGTAVG